jgi:hypothetical protein
MAADAKILIGALNIAANPHPAGIYRRLFDLVADREIPLHGSDWAKITLAKAIEDRPTLWVGNVLVWAHIDKDGKWLNKKRNAEATAADKDKIVLPPDIEPNFRSFNYAFDEKKHWLVVEFRNELGQTFGPSRAEKFFTRLFGEKIIGKEGVEVAVTVIPTEDALERIFRIPKLRWLRIHNTRPNAEDLTDEADALYARLKEMGAKSQDLELVKAAKVKALKPDSQIMALGAAAAVDGFVEGKGKNEAGGNVFESTKQHPKVIEVEIQGRSSFAAFFSSLRNFV